MHETPPSTAHPRVRPTTPTSAVAWLTTLPSYGWTRSYPVSHRRRSRGLVPVPSATPRWIKASGRCVRLCSRRSAARHFPPRATTCSATWDLTPETWWPAACVPYRPPSPFSHPKRWSRPLAVSGPPDARRRRSGVQGRGGPRTAACSAGARCWSGCCRRLQLAGRWLAHSTEEAVCAGLLDGGERPSPMVLAPHRRCHVCRACLPRATHQGAGGRR